MGQLRLRPDILVSIGGMRRWSHRRFLDSWRRSTSDDKDPTFRRQPLRRRRPRTQETERTSQIFQVFLRQNSPFPTAVHSQGVSDARSLLDVLAKISEDSASHTRCVNIIVHFNFINPKMLQEIF